MSIDVLYNWVFHYNPYTEIWAAIPVEQYNAYWNKEDSPNILRSKNFESVMLLAIKVSQDPDYLKSISSSDD